MSKKTRKAHPKKKTPSKRSKAKRAPKKSAALRARKRPTRVYQLPPRHYSKADLREVLDPKCLKNPLCKVRLSKGMSRSALAKKADVSEECIRNIELRGASPQLRTLNILAKALDVSVAKLVA